LFLAGWLAVCAAVLPLLFRLASMALDRRRENLGLI
jgi:hypothetical protein